MIQRLLFDGINLQRGRRAVSQAIEFSVLIDADEAESRLTRPNVAMAGTKIAVDLPRRFKLPPAGLVKMFRLLEDLQLFHGSSSRAPLYLRAEESARVIQVGCRSVLDLQAWRRRWKRCLSAAQSTNRSICSRYCQAR